MTEVQFFKGFVVQHEGDSVLCELWDPPAGRELLVSFLICDHAALANVLVGYRLKVRWVPETDETHIEAFSPEDDALWEA